jgi:anti-sigma factor RsiW
MRCEAVVEALPGIVDGPQVAELELRRHVESCLRCQAELVQYRRLLRALHQLRTEVLDPAPGLFTDILAAIEEAGERGAVRSLLSGRRGAYLGGLAAATAAAGAAGAIVLASRARQRRVRLAG